MSDRITELENAMASDEMQGIQGTDLDAIKRMISGYAQTNLRNNTNTDNIKIYNNGFMNLPHTMVGFNYNEDRFAEYLKSEVERGARVYFFEPGSAAPIELKSTESGKLSFETPDLSPEAPVVTKPSGWKRFANWITRGSAYKADFDAYAEQQKAAEKWEENHPARNASSIRRHEIEDAGSVPVMSARANTVSAVQTKRVELTAEQLREESRRRDEANWDITIGDDGKEIFTSKKTNEYGGRVQVRVITEPEQKPARPSAQKTDPEKGGKGMH